MPIFEIKGLKGGALKPVWATAQPYQRPPIDRELALCANYTLAGGNAPPCFWPNPAKAFYGIINDHLPCKNNINMSAVAVSGGLSAKSSERGNSNEKGAFASS
jgi:hypothetical protein